MDSNLHVNTVTDEAESLHDRGSEHSLLNMLTESIRGLEAVTRCRDHYNGAVGGRRCTGGVTGRGGGGATQRGNEEGMLGPVEDEEEDDEERGRRDDEEREERECKQRVLGVMRELSAFHSDRVTAWRGVLREYQQRPPPGGSNQQHPAPADTGCQVIPCSDSFSSTLLSIGEDIDNIINQMSTIVVKLEEEYLKLSAEETSTVDAALQETRDPNAPEKPEDDNHLYSHDPLEPDSVHDQDVEDGGGQGQSVPLPDTEQTPDSNSSDCNDAEETEKDLVVKGQGGENKDCVSTENHTDLLEETEHNANRLNDTGKEETNKEWITVGRADEQDTCFIRAPLEVAEVLKCEVADTLSCLMVTASEELVSRVIRLKVQDGANVHFPVTVALPFCARYRGSYRDVAVKIVDGERRASYITPVTKEGTYGGQRGSFAQVKVYSLGLFAVVSCLKRENYTVPTKGLSLKLPMDPRICLNYLPGSFTAPVMAQTMIQPVDAVLLAATKSRSDAYHSVVSTSPLLYLIHPSSQPLRRPLTLTLPCPPNTEKKKHTRGEGEAQDHQTQPVSASQLWNQSNRRRFLGTSLKSKEMSSELLIVLVSRDKQWSVLDKITVRNQQNGLVSFELTETFDSLLVVRLLSPLQPCHLTSLAEELEESVCCHAVNIVLQRRQDEPHAVLVAALPSRDLNWELNKLRTRGYSGLPDTAVEISMCEGDQLLLRFSGNITSTGSQNGQHSVPHEQITFHSQQKNHLLVRLTEVDPFGNYSSPHYKGTAMFYKVSRGQLEWRGDRPVPVDTKLLGEPVCKLSLTLPKKVRSINRPMTVRVKLCEETEHQCLHLSSLTRPPDSLSDSLLLWLSGELSEEEVGLLVLALRLRRSAAQLVKLRAGDSLSTQAFHVLAMWRRGLPAATHQPKASQLAHCLAKSGRPDLARELLLRQAAATRQDSLE